ncbi:MFS general substrate transporter [Phanerochaete sordida]|uniref:Autophagy-related protein n=1 Tax=Phanerochaete sordida TaxID=48140 RepID=A0A9P3GSP1_9APHY|nr:MFS general substrate transporter [Phanerochaete sordida]
MTEELVYDSRRYRKWLWGWLSYAFASEVFVVVSLTLFLPICLEQFARDNGYLLPDRTVPCSAANSTIPPTNTTSSDAAAAVAPEDIRCVVKLGWMWIDTASFSLYVNSMSVALQALTVISMGNIADHPPHRKLLLLFFAFFGSISATLFFLLPSSSPVWPLSALLGICANVGFGASVVAMNAYLPTLARASEEVVKARADMLAAEDEGVLGRRSNDDEGGDASEPLLASGDPGAHSESGSSPLHEAYNNALSRATSRISSFGIALGYAAGIVLLILALIPVTKLRGTTFALRLAIGMSGIWWAAFSLPAAAWLPSGKSKEIEVDAEDDGRSTEPWNSKREIFKAWKRLGNMLRWREVKRLRNTFKFLGAWFLLSDGFTTMTSTAMLFAKTSLHMPASALVLIGIITPVAGIAGSLAWPRLQRWRGWSNLRVLVTLVVLATLVPAYGCLGFIPAFRNGSVRFGGLTTPAEMYVLAVYFGSVYGAFQGYARAFYSELIPHGEEARWYALYSITDKSSSFVGPLIVGLIADTTGNIRYAFFFLIFMVWAAVPLLCAINVERGRRDAAGYRFKG